MFRPHDNLAETHDDRGPVPITHRCGGGFCGGLGRVGGGWGSREVVGDRDKRGNDTGRAGPGHDMGGASDDGQADDEAGAQDLAGAVAAVLGGELALQRFDDLAADRQAET